MTTGLFEIQEASRIIKPRKDVKGMKRINTAVWYEKYGRWQIKVQKDGQRRTFTSSKPGRTGQREANAKADAWLDEGIDKVNSRVDELFQDYIVSLKETGGKQSVTVPIGFSPIAGRNASLNCLRPIFKKH